MALALLKLSTILTAILAPALGIFTLFRNPRSPVNRLWFATSLAVTVWSVGYLLAMFTRDVNAARMYLSVVYTGATLIPILYFHFVSQFLLRLNRSALAGGYLFPAARSRTPPRGEDEWRVGNNPAPILPSPQSLPLWFFHTPSPVPAKRAAG